MLYHTRSCKSKGVPKKLQQNIERNSSIRCTSDNGTRGHSYRTLYTEIPSQSKHVLRTMIGTDSAKIPQKLQGI